MDKQEEVWAYKGHEDAQEQEQQNHSIAPQQASATTQANQNSKHQLYPGEPSMFRKLQARLLANASDRDGIKYETEEVRQARKKVEKLHKEVKEHEEVIVKRAYYGKMPAYEVRMGREDYYHYKYHNAIKELPITKQRLREAEEALEKLTSGTDRRSEAQRNDSRPIID